MSPYNQSKRNGNWGICQKSEDRYGENPTDEKFRRFQDRTKSNMKQPHIINRHARVRGKFPGQAKTMLRNNLSNNVESIGGRRYVGLQFWRDLSERDSKEVITLIDQNRQAVLQFFQSPFEEPDLYFLTLKVMKVVCNSSFDQLKYNLLLEVCNSQFIINLRNYLIDLPFSTDTDCMYFENQGEFWEMFICFCEYIINMFPTIALNKCRSLIDNTSECCLEGLRDRRGFNLPQEHTEKLKHLRKRLAIHEEEAKTAVPSQPPEDFRKLSVLPRREDLLERRPFLRPNIIDGGYMDIEHYLDVQFRLLREDCFGPLRDGIKQYFEDPNRKKYDNIRVFRNVKFIQPYASNHKVGCVVEVDENARRSFRNINWNHNKRFIYGSLLLFSKDDCQSFIVATILDKNLEYLTEGKIPVSLEDGADVDGGIYNTDDRYIMIESEVYFEPYINILKVLQDPTFPQDIPMSNYIVKVEPKPHHPKYLSENMSYKIKLNSREEEEEDMWLFRVELFEFSVLNENTWPSRDELQLDESQYEAYRLALTHEFAVIQGPPGTGKTFLGVKIARTLIDNLSKLRTGCILLLICYTNHALDQFLEAIIPVTKSLVRIGGQSRSEAMSKYNLKEIRRRSTKDHDTYSFFTRQQSVLETAYFNLLLTQQILRTINDGVLSYHYIQKHIPESNIIARYTQYLGDPLNHWLFEHMPRNSNKLLLKEVIDEYTNNPIDDDIYYRGDIHDEINRLLITAPSPHSFLIDEAKSRVRDLFKKINESAADQENVMANRHMIGLLSKINMFQTMSMLRSEDSPLYELPEDPSQCPTELRWRIYFAWVDRVMHEMRKEMKSLQKEFQAANTAYEEAKMMIDLEILQNTKVIGMTTSGAAKFRKLVKALGPPIVIVEEAAEVMEQHIVTSLTNDCQHLILIGDHQQLRPSAAHMKLARHFNLEVSLFERMIVNNIHSRRLNVQHRMRPEIAALVSPHIYPDLLNHPSVEKFPRVRGMCNNLFFFTHNYNEEEVRESASKANHMEADMVLHLANYLMQQEYDPEDITILAAYSGQMFYMRQQRARYQFLKNVKITVVDNYQGEESKIILLSLVRNNSEGRIGFLKTENRICVALSRAREGFYIFGNIEMLKNNSDLWVKVAETLQNNGSLGTSLHLQCGMHHDQKTKVTTIIDFKNVPDGGCSLKCQFNLPRCSHQCPLMCHNYDQEHINVFCSLKCERSICKLQHECPFLCGQTCAPCQTPVLKTLPCGHSKQLPCKQDPTDPFVQCQVQVSVTLPHCRHETKKPCFRDIRYITCPVSCDAVLSCGHTCTLECHVTRDPDHKKFECREPCTKAKKGCTYELEGDLGPHQCTNECYAPCDDCEVKVVKKRNNCKHTDRVACDEDVDVTPCRKKCARALPCGHFCKKRCFEKCGDCQQQVKKKIADCGHEVSVECSVEPARELCTQGCERTLDCGHPCPGRCAAPCDETRCLVIMPRKFDSLCGHKVAPTCNIFASVSAGTVKPEILMEYCTEPCGKTLACGHVCGGTCRSCRQGRLHVPCTQTCNQIFICGHQCQLSCNQICQPCTKPCELKCEHRKCKNGCGQPCTGCKAPCSRHCEHGECSQRCDQPCSLGPCSEPCGKLLPCEHPCRGLCGEPCPPVCNICRPEDFPKDFLGDDFEKDAKFILLEDCNHVVNFETIDNLMFGDSETVSIRACPYCHKPIVNTHRYKNLVNDLLKKDVNQIMERVYGTKPQIEKKKNELKTKVKAIISASPTIASDKNWRVQNWNLALKKLVTKLSTKKNESLLDLEMRIIYLNLLETLSGTYDLYIALKSDHFKEQIIDQVNEICQLLMNSVQKISQQQQKDIAVEIKRMNSIIQLAEILNQPSYKCLKEEEKVKNAFENAKDLLTGWTVYNDIKGMEALKLLQDTMNLSGIVKKVECELIVSAIGLKAGHWFKCPNGHFYCVGDCGGATLIGKCTDCDAD